MASANCKANNLASSLLLTDSKANMHKGRIMAAQEDLGRPIFNARYLGGANMGGVRKFFDDF